MTATAYDLSYKAVAKQENILHTELPPREPVPQSVEPLLLIKSRPVRKQGVHNLPESYSHMNGVYVAEDTGSLIKGNKIDIFFGEDNRRDGRQQKALEFGIQLVEVYLLE